MNTNQKFLLYVLRTGDMTVEGLADETGLSTKSVNAAVQGLRASDSAHICSWVKTAKGQDAAVWRVGSGEDAPRPERPKPVKAAKPQEPKPPTRMETLAAQMRAAGVDMSSPFAVAMWQVAR